MVICFDELGQDVHVTGGGLDDAINGGVRQGYTERYLRASIVRSPFDRVNTGDNTPAVIHVDIVAGGPPPPLILAQGGGRGEPPEDKKLAPAAGAGGGGGRGIHWRPPARPAARPPPL